MDLRRLHLGGCARRDQRASDAAPVASAKRGQALQEQTMLFLSPQNALLVLRGRCRGAVASLGRLLQA